MSSDSSPPASSASKGGENEAKDAVVNDNSTNNSSSSATTTAANGSNAEELNSTNVFAFQGYHDNYHLPAFDGAEGSHDANSATDSLRAPLFSDGISSYSTVWNGKDSSSSATTNGVNGTNKHDFEYGENEGYDRDANNVVNSSVANALSNSTPSTNTHNNVLPAIPPSHPPAHNPPANIDPMVLGGGHLMFHDNRGEFANPYHYFNGNHHTVPSHLGNPYLNGNGNAPHLNYINFQGLGNGAQGGLGLSALTNMAANPPINASICKFFASGHCAKGNQCNYAHMPPSVVALPHPQKDHSLMHHSNHHSQTFAHPMAAVNMVGGRMRRDYHNNNNNNYSNNNNNNGNNNNNQRGNPDRYQNNRRFRDDRRSNGNANQEGGQGYHKDRFRKNDRQHRQQQNTQNNNNNTNTNDAGNPSQFNETENLSEGSKNSNTINGNTGSTNGITASAPARRGPFIPNNTAEGDAAEGDDKDDHNRYAPSSDFLAKFGPNPTIEELQGHMYLIAKDQYGCRLLQRMLEEKNETVIGLVFGECFEHINELMTDPFGNYLCQKLIEFCSEDQRFAIMQKVSNDLVAISLNMHGTRAVQKLVESLSTPREVEVLVNAIKGSVVTLIKDLNGNHVIQRALHHLVAKDNQFIYDAVAKHLVSVATHKHGTCVLQRCVDYATVPQKRQLVQEIVNNALELVQDAFGNYAVQYVLDLGEPPISNGIIANLLGSVSSLAVQKFSSNVVEKCLDLAGDKMRSKLIDELINVERLPRLLQDPYANYVIQKALGVSKKVPAQFDKLVAVIKPHLTALRNTSFGKRIQNKILKKFPDLHLENADERPHRDDRYNGHHHPSFANHPNAALLNNIGLGNMNIGGLAGLPVGGMPINQNLLNAAGFNHHQQLNAGINNMALNASFPHELTEALMMPAGNMNPYLAVNAHLANYNQMNGQSSNGDASHIRQLNPNLEMLNHAFPNAAMHFAAQQAAVAHAQHNQNHNQTRAVAQA